MRLAVATLVVALLCAAVYRSFFWPTTSSLDFEAVRGHPRGFFQQRPWYNEGQPVRSLKGRIAIVTGSSSGIGKAAAYELYRLGATVVVTSRNVQRAKAATTWMQHEASQDSSSSGQLEAQALDLSDLDSVRKFVDDFMSRHDRLDYLSENAGIGPLAFGWQGPWLSKQGYELLYASNYLGHFLLLQLLLPVLDRSQGAVVATSSISHWWHDLGADQLRGLVPERQRKSDETKGFMSSFRQYGNTKLLQILMCFEMQRRHSSVPCTPVAPGFIATSIANPALDSRDGIDRFLPFARSTRDGAMTTLHALLSRDDANATGVFLQPYYTPPHESAPNPSWGPLIWEGLGQHFTWGLRRWAPHVDAYDRELAKLIWDKSMVACGLETKS